MSLKGKKAVKVCNFYVNNWHLLTMLFPYLNKNIDKKTGVVTILEDNLENYAENLIEKIILNNKDKEKIMDVNWDKTNIKDENFESYLKENIEKNNESIIIVNGNADYIENTNSAVYNLMNKKEIPSKSIKIINCFDISNDAINMNDILSKHERVLNTLGETKVEEFAGDNK